MNEHDKLTDSEQAMLRKVARLLSREVARKAIRELLKKAEVEAIEAKTGKPVTAQETVERVANQWHAYCLILMQKMRWREARITFEDVRRSEGHCILIQEQPDYLHVQVMTNDEAERLARERGDVAFFHETDLSSGRGPGG